MAALQISLRGRALRFLSMREHSRLELERKLARHAPDSDDIKAVLDALEEDGYLSQERFTAALIRRRAHRFGNSRIVAELQSHGMGGAALRELEAGLTQNETARACEVWRRKFGSVAPDAKERAKQIRFLMQRGFSPRAIQVALKGATANE